MIQKNVPREIFRCSKQLSASMVAQLNAADKKLLTKYQTNLKILDENGNNRLIKAQRLWVQYKEADCAQVINQMDDRTHVALFVFQCLIDKSSQREKVTKQNFKLIYIK